MEMQSAIIFAFINCLYLSPLYILPANSSPPLPIGVHPLDEAYYEGEVIKCKDGSKSFTRDRLNDNFCDCIDGTDEPGTAACPAGTFYCRNRGSTPKFLFSSRVNDHICDCCDGSDEYDGNVMCPNTCIGGGNIVYERLTYNPVTMNSRKTKPSMQVEEDSLHKLIGLKALVVLQVALVVFVVFRLFCWRKHRKRITR